VLAAYIGPLASCPNTNNVVAYGFNICALMRKDRGCIAAADGKDRGSIRTFHVAQEFINCCPTTADLFPVVLEYKERD
jgi:hypothetical protein